MHQAIIVQAKVVNNWKNSDATPFHFQNVYLKINKNRSLFNTAQELSSQSVKSKIVFMEDKQFPYFDTANIKKIPGGKRIELLVPVI
jgi:hypothetical protein